jgi:hypothetical protein
MQRIALTLFYVKASPEPAPCKGQSALTLLHVKAVPNMLHVKVSLEPLTMLNIKAIPSPALFKG